MPVLGKCGCCNRPDIQAAYAGMIFDFFRPFNTNYGQPIGYNSWGNLILDNNEQSPIFQPTQYLTETMVWDFSGDPAFINGTSPLVFTRTRHIDQRTGLNTYTYDPPAASTWVDQNGVTNPCWVFNWYQSGPYGDWSYAGLTGPLPQCCELVPFVIIGWITGPYSRTGKVISSPTTKVEAFTSGSATLVFTTTYSDAWTWNDARAAANALLDQITLLNPTQIYSAYAQDILTGVSGPTNVSFGYKSDPMPAGATLRLRSLMIRYPILGTFAHRNNFDIISPGATIPSQAAIFVLPNTSPNNVRTQDGILCPPQNVVAFGLNNATGIDYSIIGFGVVAANGFLCDDSFFKSWVTAPNGFGPYRLDSYMFAFQQPPSATNPPSMSFLVSQKSALRCGALTTAITDTLDPAAATLVWNGTNEVGNQNFSLSVQYSQPGKTAGEMIYDPSDAPAGGRLAFSTLPITPQSGSAGGGGGDGL